MSNAQGDCFQILGFDVFIDHKLKAWIFEINDHPSLNINLEKEGQKGLIKEVSEIDKYIKMKIVGEAIKLMKKKDVERSEIESYKGYHRILPSTQFQGYESFYNAKKIFDYLIGKKGGQMTMSKFSKISKIKGMSNCSLNRTHYEILFKRILSRLKVSQMSLEIFFEALEGLSETLYPDEIEKLDALIANLTNNINGL